MQAETFRRILCIFEDHNIHTKRTTKENLQRKYQWLLSKYYKRIIPADSGLITQDHSERVTVINVPDISDNEMSLLALGPNYALNPKADNLFVNKVIVDLALCAVQLRNHENKASTEEAVIPSKSLYRSPFQIPFIRTPETASHETEDKLTQLSKFMIKTMKNDKITDNLTHQQRTGLKSLRRREDLHKSVSDKCGEFVVTTKETHKQVTSAHLESISIYEYIPPTREVKNSVITINNPTDLQYSRQIINETSQLEADANKIWKDIYVKHEFYFKLWMNFNSVNCTLSCLYVNVKTHKFDVDYFTNFFQNFKIVLHFYSNGQYMDLMP